MLLAPRTLVTVTEYENQSLVEVSGRTSDVIEVTFYGKKRFLFWTYEGYTTKQYTFPMPFVEKDKKGVNIYRTGESASELIKQLRENFSNQTSFLSSEDYDFFREKFPERFI